MMKTKCFNKMNMKKIIFAAIILFAAWCGIFTEMTTFATQVENESSKSPDNSLSSLKLSQGTLSPGFYYSTTSYTATVPYETNSVEVTAKTSNSKAEVESISGASDLQVGENTITIIVRAENGAKAVYTVKVTRESSPAGGSNGGTTGTDTGEADEALDTGGTTGTGGAGEASGIGGTTGGAGETPGTGETTGGAGEASDIGGTTGGAGEIPDTGAEDTESEAYRAQIEEYENRMSLLQKEYEKLEKKYESEKSFARTMIAILSFVLVAVVIAGINMIIFMKRKSENKEDKKDKDAIDAIEAMEESDMEDDEDWLDEDDEADFQREIPFVKKNKKTVDAMEKKEDIEKIDVIDFDKL